MVPIKPHSAIIWPMEEVAGSDGVLGNPTASGAAALAQGYFELLSTSQVLERFGVEVQSGAVFLMDVSEAGKFGSGSEVLVEGRYYTVIGHPLLFQAGLDTDHAEVLLEGKDTPIQGV